MLIVSLLPLSWRDKAKAVVALLGAVLGVAVTVVPNSPAWLTTVVALATALGVYGVPNVQVPDNDAPERPNA